MKKAGTRRYYDFLIIFELYNIIKVEFDCKILYIYIYIYIFC